MRARVVLLFGIAACGFHAPEGESPVDARVTDAPPAMDAPIDGGRDAVVDGPADGAPITCLQRWHSELPVEFEAPVPVAINTSDSERDPKIGWGDGRLYFSAERPGVTNDDIFSAPPTSAGDFGTAVRETLLSNSQEDDGKLTMNSAETLAIGTRRGGATHKRMVPYVRTDMGELWTAGNQSLVQTPHATDNPDLVDSVDAELSGDGLQLFFTRIANGDTHQSIWVSSRQDTDDDFPDADIVFTDDGGPSNYADPALSADSLVFIFSSTKPHADTASRTDGELYYTFRDEPDGDLKEHDPIWIPSVGSPQNDGDATLSKDGCTLYFASSRAGNYDIYSAKLKLP